MKYLLSIVLIAILASCGQAHGDEPRIGRYVGEVTHRVYALTFKTPDGTHCVSLVRYDTSVALDCDFSSTLR